MYDHGISLNTILVHSVILKKDVCDLGEEFEYKILHFRLLLACFRPFRNRSKFAINTASLSSVARISEWCWICTFKAYVFKIKQRILLNLSTLMHQFFQCRNIQRGSLSTIGVKGLIVRQLYTQSYLYNIRVFFRVETSTRRDAKDSLRRCWYNNLAKSFLTHP